MPNAANFSLERENYVYNILDLILFNGLFGFQCSLFNSLLVFSSFECGFTNFTNYNEVKFWFMCLVLGDLQTRFWKEVRDCGKLFYQTNLATKQVSLLDYDYHWRSNNLASSTAPENLYVKTAFSNSCYDYLDNLPVRSLINSKSNFIRILEGPKFSLQKNNIKSLFFEALADNKESKNFLSGSVSNIILGLTNEFWDRLSFDSRWALIQFVTGFQENSSFDCTVGPSVIEYTDIRPDDTDLLRYLEDETKCGRLIKMGHEEANVPFKFMAFKILKIKETKVRKDGSSFVKVRFVYNQVQANKLIHPITYKLDGSPGQFSTPVIDDLFKYDIYYKRLMCCSWASCFDRKDYYRSFFLHPKSWPLSVIVSRDSKGKKTFYVDVAGRMGARNSSLFAQSLANLMDEVTRLWFAVPDGSIISNQDDTLLIGQTDETCEFYRLLNGSLKVTLNESKTIWQSPSVRYLGYDLNLKDKLIGLKPKRISNFRAVVNKICNSQFSSKRDYAKLLGHLWAAKIILFGQNFFINPGMGITRKICGIFTNFVDEKIVDIDKEYDVLVKRNQLAVNEILQVAKLMENSITFHQAREAVLAHLRIGRQLAFEASPSIVASCDASGYGVGICIYARGEWFAYHVKLNAMQNRYWSINVKETFGLWLTKLLCVKFWAEGCLKEAFECNRFRNSKKSMITIYVDNKTAQSVAVLKKASLRSLELGILAKLITLIEAVFPVQFAVGYINTKLNWESDWLSRMKNVNCPIMEVFSQSFCPFFLNFGDRFGSKAGTRQGSVRQLSQIVQSIKLPPPPPQETRNQFKVQLAEFHKMLIAQVSEKL